MLKYIYLFFLILNFSIDVCGATKAYDLSIERDKRIALMSSFSLETLLSPDDIVFVPVAADQYCPAKFLGSRVVGYLYRPVCDLYGHHFWAHIGVVGYSVRLLDNGDVRCFKKTDIVKLSKEDTERFLCVQ